MGNRVAPRRGTEMDFRHDQRLGTTLGLSAGLDWREGPLVRAAFGNFAMFAAALLASSRLKRITWINKQLLQRTPPGRLHSQ
jgi:hypothetical protein